MLSLLLIHVVAGVGLSALFLCRRFVLSEFNFCVFLDKDIHWVRVECFVLSLDYDVWVAFQLLIAGLIGVF